MEIEKDEKQMKEKIKELCACYSLGDLQEEPQIVAGGLLHKMYRVVTNNGEYAIKVLNPDIMKRPEALQNMIHSEMVSNELKDSIPLIAAKNFQGKNILEFDGLYYVIFDWLEGKSVFSPDINIYHCEQIGRILGKIHAANIEVGSIEQNESSRELFAWNLLLEKAKKQTPECYMILKENLDDIFRWDRQVVDGWNEIARHQVISHRDLDPKNVMWRDEQPYIIDWEAAGFINPYQELIEVLNYWIKDESGEYDKEKFRAIMRTYKENVDIGNVNWEVVLGCSFDGMLGWLEYSIKRALGLEGTGTSEQQEGMQQIKETITELRRYEAQLELLKNWLKEAVV